MIAAFRKGTGMPIFSLGERRLTCASDEWYIAPTANVIGSVRLGQAMENRAGNALALEDWEIVRLHGQFFEPANFTLNTLSVSDYPRVAAEMDWFDERATYSTPIYHTAVISPFTEN